MVKHFAEGNNMEYVYNDGGRVEAGFKGKSGDCVVRAIAIAAELPYMRVYKDLRKINSDFANGRSRTAKKIQTTGPTPRNGNYKDAYHNYVLSLGFKWVSAMSVGSGCKVHLTDGELPNARVIARLSRHLCAVVDGVINDTYDPSRKGTRCVYGYYVRT